MAVFGSSCVCYPTLSGKNGSNIEPLLFPKLQKLKNNDYLSKGHLMDIQKLTKKNQEFIHIATNQLIKDGKIRPRNQRHSWQCHSLNLSKIRKKELQDVDSWCSNCLGSLVSLLKNQNLETGKP